MVAPLLRIHELAGYSHALFLFYQPLVAVPFSYGVSYKSTLALTPFRCSTQSTDIESSLTHSLKAHLAVKLFVHLLHRIQLARTSVVHTFFSTPIALHRTCCAS